MLGQSASPLRVGPAANRNFALRAADGIADMANRVNKRGFTEFFPEPANEHLNQLGIVFVRMLPDAFAQLRACELDAAGYCLRSPSLTVTGQNVSP